MKKVNNIDILKFKENDSITLYGWVSNIRKMGQISFVDFRDRTGFVQLIFSDKINFSKESVLKVQGILNKRKSPNLNMPTGNYEINVQNYEILSISEELPFEIKDDLNAKEDTKLKHRYLDLRRPKMYSNLWLRHNILRSSREFFHTNGFIEVETPNLSKSTPEGARDFLVPTRIDNKFFALPQSPQLYKQLLMISGFERYFQVARAFRDEDMRKDRQPEFTQLDVEMSFVDEDDLFLMMENLWSNIMEVVGYKINSPFERMSFNFAMDNYGCDKPDLRFDLKLLEVTDLFKNTKSDIFQRESIKMLKVDHAISSKEAKILEETAFQNNAKKVIFIKVTDSKFNENSLNLIIKKELNEIIKKYNISNSTLIFVADNYATTIQSLGSIRTKANEIFSYANEDEYKFVWIIDWPLFEMVDGNISSMHHAFTHPTKETIKFLDKEPLKVMARAYDLVLNGYELSSGSIRIHDPVLQTKIFNILKLSTEQIKNQFGFFIEAFKYGVPPHGGISFGVDRIIMILSKSKSIRDVIAFPKNANGIDVMSESPSIVSNEQLKDYKIEQKK
ncbi:MAG: aspartate--tRNA ligase [Mycoplasmataceae bacterium]|nr:aspartate--tRNA ligase [Mycoplasmataceae bacterium]